MSYPSRIGGMVDYQRLADLHRPSNSAQIAMEIRRLKADGLKPRDFAVALRIDVAAVLQVIEEHSSDASITSTKDHSA